MEGVKEELACSRGEAETVEQREVEEEVLEEALVGQSNPWEDRLWDRP